MRRPGLRQDERDILGRRVAPLQNCNLVDDAAAEQIALADYLVRLGIDRDTQARVRLREPEDVVTAEQTVPDLTEAIAARLEAGRSGRPAEALDVIHRRARKGRAGAESGDVPAQAAVHPDEVARETGAGVVPVLLSDRGGYVLSRGEVRRPDPVLVEPALLEEDVAHRAARVHTFESRGDRCSCGR